MRRHSAILSYLSLLVLAAFLLPAKALGGIVMVSGDGHAPIVDQRTRAARDSALSLAKRSAVEAAVHLAVPPVESAEKREAVDKNILRRPDRFILSYEIARDKPNAGSYEIVIEARIDLGRLAQAIHALPSRREKGEEQGRLLTLVVYEKGGKSLRFKALERGLSSRMELMGLAAAKEGVAEKVFGSSVLSDLKERRFDTLAELGETLGLGRLIFGMGSAGQEEGCPERLSFFFVDLEKRKVLTRFAYKLGRDISCKSVAEKAAEAVFSRMAEEIKEQGVLEPSGRIRVHLVIKGLADYGDVMLVKDSLAKFPAIKDIRLESFATGGEVGFRVEIEDRREYLADLVREIGGGRFRLRETTGPVNQLTFLASY